MKPRIESPRRRFPWLALRCFALGALAIVPGCGSKKTPTEPVITVRRELGPAVQYSTNGVRTGKLAIGDVNGDGRKDVVVVGHSSALLIYTQTASGVLSGPQIVNTDLDLRGVAIGDLDHDGLPELAVSGISLNALIGYLGRLEVFPGDPVTGPAPVAHGVGSNNVGDLAIGDLNSDGRNDVAVMADWTTAPGAGNISIFRQTPADTLDAEFIYQQVGVRTAGEIHIADMTGDGRADLVVQSSLLEFSAIAQLANGSLSTTPAPYTVQTSYWPNFDSFAVGDLNGDGLNDVVADAPGNNSYLNVFLQSGGTLAAPGLVPESYPPYGVEIADINGDGLNDVLGDLVSPGYPSSVGEVRVYYQSSTHTFSGFVAYTFPTVSGGGSAEHQSLAVGDVTGDGWPDAVVTWADEGVWVLPSVPTP